MEMKMRKKKKMKMKKTKKMMKKKKMKGRCLYNCVRFFLSCVYHAKMMKKITVMEAQ